MVERKRLAHERDGVMWFCERCNHKLYEVFFTLENIETDLPKVFADYHASFELRTCDACGHVDPLPAT
ncbi:3-hydroxyanthranilate 3,4-dioxygenase [compost metagenome]